MRSPKTRRMLTAAVLAVSVAGTLPLASRAIYLAVAHAELARLNEVHGTNSTLDEDTLSPANRAKSAALLEKTRLAQLAAMKARRASPASQVATSQSR